LGLLGSSTEEATAPHDAGSAQGDLEDINRNSGYSTRARVKAAANFLWLSGTSERAVTRRPVEILAGVRAPTFQPQHIIARDDATRRRAIKG
jgi:hypothetical protein